MATQDPYPGNTTPGYADDLELTAKKILKVVDDSANQSAPISVALASTGNQRTVTGSSVSTSGTVTAGAREVQFFPASGATVSVAGCPITAATKITAPTGDSLPAIAYTVSGGNLGILTIT